DHGLGKHVRFSFDGWLNACGCELLLEVICKTQIDGGPKRNLLRRSRTHSLAGVSTAQSLRWPAILDHQLKRIVFVVNDLLVLQQLEKSVIWNVFDRLHSAAVKEHRHRDQTEGDHDEDNATPIKIGFVPARSILFL